MLLSHNNFEVKFIRRQANMVAHTLVKMVIAHASRYVYDYVSPCTNVINDIS